MKEKLQRLHEIDWDFADYKGLHSFPTEINYFHWYPAPFVPQIPAILIKALSEKDDIIFDPFAGSGVTLIEAAKLKRKFIGMDINPYAVNIIKAKFFSLYCADTIWFSKIQKDIKSLTKIDDSKEYCQKFGIDEEANKWFENKTLNELCSLHHYVMNESNTKNRLLKKVLFSSILQKCCSQKDHYTYVTDGCLPKEYKYVDAVDLFLNQAELTAISAETFRKQYEMTHGEEWKTIEGIISLADARSQNFLKDNSVDMVVTSPPYLGVNDYVRSLRLTWLFFHEKETKTAVKEEIGARWKRKRKSAYEDYIHDMDKIFSEISRVLKPSGFLCLIVGQGKGKVSSNKNVVEELLQILNKKYEFNTEMKISRKIKFRRIQVAGIGNEEIIILSKARR